jgi:hypothetical protein
MQHRKANVLTACVDSIHKLFLQMRLIGLILLQAEKDCIHIFLLYYRYREISVPRYSA